MSLPPTRPVLQLAHLSSSIWKQTHLHYKPRSFSYRRSRRRRSSSMSVSSFRPTPAMTRPWSTPLLNLHSPRFLCCMTCLNQDITFGVVPRVLVCMAQSNCSWPKKFGAGHASEVPPSKCQQFETVSQGIILFFSFMNDVSIAHRVHPAISSAFDIHSFSIT